MKYLSTTLSLMLAATALAQTKPAAGLVEKVKPSLVVVQFTYDSELGKREIAGMGIVIREDGLTMVAMDLTPRQLPDSQMKDFKILIPGDDETEYAADFLGRDERYNVSFIKPTKVDTKLAPLTFSTAEAQVGEPVQSVGLLPKIAGYQAYLMTAQVSALLRGPVPQVLVTSGGLGVIGSPVFNSSGDAIGLVTSQQDRSPFLNDDNAGYMSVDRSTLFYTPAKDFVPAIKTPPTLESPIKIPFMGVNQLTGLTKDVAEFYGLKGQVAIQVGDVVPDMPAFKAGLKKGHIIVKADGQPLERGDQPEEAPTIFTRKLSQKAVGDFVTLSVLTEKDKPLTELKVIMEERPLAANKVNRSYAEDLGFTTRDVVFDDTYVRKLPRDTKGVVVAFIRQQSAAQAAQLQGGDLVQQINQTPVTDVEQFKTEYKKFRDEKPKEAVVLEVLRKGNTQIIRIEPPRE